MEKIMDTTLYGSISRREIKNRIARRNHPYCSAGNKLLILFV